MSNGLADDPPLCSVVLSVYNEALNLPAMYERLAAAVAGEPMRWEFLFVDDGSQDGSFEVLKALNERDSRVKVLRFSRNFGAHETSVAGLREAAGDCAILMASDLQDPPDLIPELLRRWREGYHVVWAKRTRREDSFFRSLQSRMYLALIRRLAVPGNPVRGIGSFCLLDRPVIDALNLLEERNRLTFELILWCGYTSAEVPYERPPRFKGVQKWTLARNVKAGIDGLLALSYAPIRWIMAFGLLVAALSLLGGLYVLGYSLFFGFHTLGWPSLMVSVLFLGGTQLVCIGFLGEYLWRILQECRRRPLYLIRDRVGEFVDTAAAPRNAIRYRALQETGREHPALS